MIAGPRQNYILFTTPKDKWSVSNSGKNFTLRQLVNAVRDSNNISQCAKNLGLRSSGVLNPYLRYKIVHYGLNALHWDNPPKWNQVAAQPYWSRETVYTPGAYAEPKNYAYKAGDPSNDQVSVDKAKLEQSAQLFLEAIGEDTTRDGLKDTPKRYAKYMADIMNGHFLKSENYVKDFENDEAYDGPVVVTNMPFYTVCEHHLAPFIGTWDFAYQPKDRILGLSKVVRIARVFMKRPQVQERLTQQIAQELYNQLDPRWVVVRMGAEHFCMSTRGVRTPGAFTYTRKQITGNTIQKFRDEATKTLLIPQGV